PSAPRWSVRKRSTTAREYRTAIFFLPKCMVMLRETTFRYQKATPAQKPPVFDVSPGFRMRRTRSRDRLTVRRQGRFVRVTPAQHGEYNVSNTILKTAGAVLALAATGVLAQP